MTRITLQYSKVILLGMLLMLQGCSAFKASHFVPESAENMREWEVEGRFVLRADSTVSKSHFAFRKIGEEYALSILMDEPVGEAKVIIHGNVYEPDSETVDVIGGAEAMKVAEHLQAHIRAGNLSYWLRGLPATADAVVYQEDLDRVDRIEEAGWDIDYQEYMAVQNYLLPSEVTFKGEPGSFTLNMVRAETAYLTHPCGQNVSPTELEAEPENSAGQDAVRQLVPSDGSPPIPRWVDEAAFCRQLVKIHGKIPDARVGLYGPDSMMWKLSRAGMPGAFGAGRALLLQLAHPWVTASIDEHSVVRDDPLGRARRTFQHVGTMVFGSMPQVMTSANQVRDIHEEIEGEVPMDSGAFQRGSEYRANEVAAMIWVHATLWETLAYMYEKMEGELTSEEKDQFYEETKLFAMLFGVPEPALPADWNAFMEYNRAMWASPQLTVEENGIRLKEDLFDPRSVWMIFPLWVQEQVTAANLPPRIRDEFEMKYGWWQKFNNALIMSGATVAQWMLPKSLERNPLYHEANARLEGKRVGAYNQFLIEALLDKERLVN
mgnify:FL=1